jgi:transposase InsO family protein
LFIRTESEKLIGASRSSSKGDSRMNIHKNARTTPQSRALIVHRVEVEHWPVSAVANALGISQRTVYKWLARYRAHGLAGLRDRRSVARRHPHALAPAWLALIRMLRHAKLVATEIAERVPVARSTVSAVLKRLGLARLCYLNPPPAVQRYEWGRPGEMIHMDIKKLGRIVQPSHRVTGNRRHSLRDVGWEYAHVAIDDCTRYTYAEILPDDKRYTATAFWLRAVREFRSQGIRVQRVLTDNGGAYCSRPFRKACRWLGISAKRTRPYRLQTNGKVERMIQTLLRKWAYAVPYPNSEHRRAALSTYLHRYNEERPHASLNRQTPLRRLAQFAEQRS